MHMADALLSPAVGAAFYVASTGLLVHCARRVAREPDYERKLPLMGVLGAFVFAAQMINFSIPGTGSSGHIGGGMLLAILLGPYAAFLVIASVLVIQCLFFADGGLLALGCNVFNMGFWPAFVGLLLYRSVTAGREMPARGSFAAVLAVVLSLELGAFGGVLETLLSGRSELPFAQFSATMLGIHFPIALIEGLITVGVVQFVRRLMPERVESAAPVRSRAVAIASLLGVAVFVSTVVAWFASRQPDGLEWSIGHVYGQEDLPVASSPLATRLDQVQEKTAVLPDYGFRPAGAAEPAPATWPAVSLGTSLAGAAGALTTAIVTFVLGGILYLIRGRKAKERHA
jgi:cobalt/nickel transport system permease protein